MANEEVNADPEGADILLAPGAVADNNSLVQGLFPKALANRYEIHSYRNAAVILKQSRPDLFAEITQMLEGLVLTTDLIRTPGGNESEIVKSVKRVLAPRGWYETSISGDLEVRLSWREPVDGTTKRALKSETHKRVGFLDGHKIDHVKGRVAFDMEWNSKDQTFDRDLYAFRAFYEAGAIDVAVILTRGVSLDNRFFRSLGLALNKDGTLGASETYKKYGASTTWMGKLLYRLEAGRNGGCPVLAIGITPQCVLDWKAAHD